MNATGLFFIWTQYLSLRLSAQLPVRDDQWITAINVWCNKKGLPLVDFPARFVIPIVSGEIVDPLLTVIADETNQEARQQMIAKLEGLGLVHCRES